MNLDTDVKAPMLKAITAWLAVLFTSLWDQFTTLPWDKFAQFAAFVYSCCLIWEFLRKKTKKEKPNGTEQNIS